MPNSLTRKRPKSLVAVFIDGTENDASPVGVQGRTNVRHTFEALAKNPDAACLYLPGVGRDARPEMDADSAGEPGVVGAVKVLLETESSLARRFFNGLFGKFFGMGLTARVLAAYAFICATRAQHPGARVCIVGFSRGAYAACVLAHFMERAGMVVARDSFGLHVDTVRQAWTYDDARLAALIRDGESTAWRLPTSTEAIRVDFLGCWDTVCAVGAPEHGLAWDVGSKLLSGAVDGLCGFVHGRVTSWNPRFLRLFVPPNVVKARHALALHEYRVAFEAMVWHPPQTPDPSVVEDIVQMWFPGAHADVGGGYPEDATAVVSSDHALAWMKHEMLPDKWFGSHPLKSTWQIHDSSDGRFRKMQPRLRTAMRRLAAGPLRTVYMADLLQLGLRRQPTVEHCDEVQPSSRPSGTLFRPAVAALHVEVHARARVAWLAGLLARAAARHSEGEIPAEYTDPSLDETTTAIETDDDHFVRILDGAELAKMIDDPARAARAARLCCYRLAMTREPSSLIWAARTAVRETQGRSAREAAVSALGTVLLAPMAFVLEHEAASTRAMLEIETFLEEFAAAPAKLVKI